MEPSNLMHNSLSSYFEDYWDPIQNENSTETCCNEMLTANENQRAEASFTPSEPSQELQLIATLSESSLVNLPEISTAPFLDSVEMLRTFSSKRSSFNGSLKELLDSNYPAELMFAPIQGPLFPHQRRRNLQEAKQNNMICGNIEKCHVSDIAFDVQRHTFQKTGAAEDPSDMTIISGVKCYSALLKPSEKPTDLLQNSSPEKNFSSTITIENETKTLSRKQKKVKREPSGIPGTSTYLGPWASLVGENEQISELGTEACERQRIYEIEKAKGTLKDYHMTDEKIDGKTKVEAKPKTVTIFHGKSETNFQGLSWISKPQGAKERDEEVLHYLPKRVVHTYVGHLMGVQAIRFFPTYGHLLLSASMDSKCKIWDVYNQRKCLRTYMGHTMGVRDIQFADQGRKFYSCSFDKKILCWDTEYGKIIGTYSNDKTPYCVSVHPGEGMDHIFIIGSSNKRAVQFDAKTGEITQEYNEHLGAVNTVTFCEDGNKIVTTADDKKMFIWEFGIPVVVKHIAEPHMHSMPAARLHPSKKFLVCQSMDNQIVVYEATGRFRFQGPKRFRGHWNAGYAILPGFSPDGRYLMSGDVSGKIWFWDWKSMKNQRTISAHDRVCMGSEWHPTMVSRIATCGWDGLIKLWD